MDKTSSKIGTPVKLKLSHNLRDFMMTMFGDYLDLAINRKKTDRLGNSLICNIKKSIKYEQFPTKAQNTIHTQFNAEYILIIANRKGITPYINKQIYNLISDYFNHYLLLEMAISKAPNMRAKILEFIDKYNLRHENALDNIEFIIKNKRANLEKRRQCKSTDTKTL